MRTFIFLVCAFAVFAQISAGQYDSKKLEAAKLCQKQLNVPQEVASILNKESVPTTEHEKCFLECVYEKLDVVKGGKINREMGNEYIKEKVGSNPELHKQISEAFDFCEKKYTPDPSEKCGLGRTVRECIFNSAEGAPLKIFTKN